MDDTTRPPDPPASAAPPTQRPDRGTLRKLGKRIIELQAYKNAIDQRQLTDIREFDRWNAYLEDHARSMSIWLQWQTGVKPGAAGERVRVARKLGELPYMDSVMARGLLSYTQVRALTRYATPWNERRLVDHALALSGAQLERLTSRLRRRIAVDRNEPALRGEERVRFSDAGDGMDQLTLVLRGEQTVIVRKGLDAIKREAPDLSDGDAMVVLAERSLAAEEPARAAPGRWEGVLFVGAATLRHGQLHPQELCELEGQVPISAETARRLMCDGRCVTVLVDEKGDPIDVGRRRRTVTNRQRQLLLARDKHCRFPGCTNEYYLDAHHIEHWASGGKTNLANLILLCRSCHVKVHEGGIKLLKRRGKVRFVLPDGRALPSGPRLPDLSRRRGDPVERAEQLVGPVEPRPYLLGPPTPFEVEQAVENILASG